MAVTTRIVNFIGGHEGFVSTWYLDPVHVPTIGYGFTWSSAVFRGWWTKKHGRKMQKGDTISQADAHEVLLSMIADEYAPPVDAKFQIAPGNVLEAGYSAVFNLGPGALAWKWAKAIARGDLTEGARLWRTMGTTAKGKKLPGLVRRRGEEADMAEFNRWPAWVGATADAPASHVDEVDIKQAQIWLTELGYDCGVSDGIPGPRTVAATERFQRDHGNLKVDGVIGAATLAALQRAKALKKAATVTVGGGAATTATGVGENATGAGDAIDPGMAGIGDWILWGGLGVAAIVLAYFFWRYRDELVTAFKKL